MAMLNNQRVYIDDIDVNGHHFTSMAMNPMISISTSFHEKLHRCEIGEHSDVNVNNNMAYIYIQSNIYMKLQTTGLFLPTLGAHLILMSRGRNLE